MPNGTWKAANDTFDVHKCSITALGPQPRKRCRKILVIRHVQPLGHELAAASGFGGRGWHRGQFCLLTHNCQCVKQVGTSADSIGCWKTLEQWRRLYQTRARVGSRRDGIDHIPLPGLLSIAAPRQDRPDSYISLKALN